MRERATLKLDAGDELRVEVERDELARDAIVVRRATENGPAADHGWLALSDEHLAIGDKVSYGPQHTTHAGVRVFVLPSTSGVARRHWDIAYWHELARQAGRHRRRGFPRAFCLR